MEDGVTVWLEEEYGYRYWKWETGMSETELVAWWSNMPSVVPFFHSPIKLPGLLSQVDSEDWDSMTRDMPEEPPADFDEQSELPECVGDDSEECREFVRYYARLSAAPRKVGLYRAHLHWEDDSGLFLPDGRTVRHAGYQEISDED